MVKDDLDRKWKWKIELAWIDGLLLSLCLYLIRFKKEKCLLSVGSYFVHFKIKYWKIKATHFWYDGPHCCWQLGPIAVGKEGLGDCKKCVK